MVGRGSLPWLATTGRVAIPGPALTVIECLVVAGAYYGLAQLGPMQHLGPGPVRLLWPPTGIAVAAVLLAGPRILPGVGVGSFLVNMFALHRPPPQSVVLCAGTVAAVSLTFLLLRRMGFHRELDRLRDALSLVFATLAAMVLNTSVSMSVLVLAGLQSDNAFWLRWLLLWMSNVMGVLLLAPVLLLLYRVRRPRRVRPLRVLEIAVILTGTFLVTLLATRSSTQFLFLVFPFLIWAALRFQLPGAAPCALIASIVVTYGASNAGGPFAGHGFVSNLITIETFNGSMALTALVLAAIIAELTRAYGRVEDAANEIAAAVNRLDERLRPEDAPSHGQRRRST
ncbi:MASE1 domain-containing protein [Actinopolymorpha pittospori]